MGFRFCRSFSYVCRFCGLGVCLFEEDEVVVKEPVSDEINTAVDLIDGMDVIFGELGGNADESRGGGVYLPDGFCSEFVSDKFAEVRFVI